MDNSDFVRISGDFFVHRQVGILLDNFVWEFGAAFCPQVVLVDSTGDMWITLRVESIILAGRHNNLLRFCR